MTSKILRNATMILLLAALATPVASQEALTEVASKKDPLCQRSVCFPAVAKIADREVPARATGHLKVWGFDVYSAALYIDSSIHGVEKVLGETPRRLVLHYYRGISKEDFIKSTKKFIEKDPANDTKALAARLDRLYAAYRSVEKGDEYALTYTPGVGTRLSLNNVDLVTIEGQDFGRAVFGIWLGEYALNSSLRDALHGLPK